jgi:hypothetical protein
MAFSPFLFREADFSRLLDVPDIMNTRARLKNAFVAEEKSVYEL